MSITPCRSRTGSLLKARRRSRREYKNSRTRFGELSATLRHFYDSASVMMGTVEVRDHDILHISDNRAAATFFGTTPEAMRGRTAQEMGVPEAYIALWLGAYHTSVTSDGPVRFDYHHEGKGWLKVTVDHIGLRGGRPRFLYVVDDISDRKHAEEALSEAHDLLEARVRERTDDLEAAKRALEAANAQLQRDAFYDLLTGLPNRLLFSDRLKHALGRYHRDPDLGFAVLFIDLDHFKVINDSLGHPAGDALLTAVGERLTGCVREGDTVARFGGDEFAVLLENCDPERAAEVAGRLRGAFAQPFEVWERTFTLTGSVGMVFSDGGHSRPQDLLRDADLAMYRAKAHRSGRHEVFSADMREGALRRLELEADMRLALGARSFTVYFQPIIRLTDLHLIGFEALARWHHPKHGLLTPDAFIPLAEETGLIIELDRYVLREACRQLGAWRDEFSDFEELSVNVNLSSQQFLHEGLAPEVEHALHRSDLSPQHLNLEITEGLLMHPVAAVDEVVGQLAALGVGLCLDDYGTGYASLSYLRRFPATGLKLDRSFVHDMSADAKSMTLVGGVAAMAQKLGLKMVAEGVETSVQCDRLRGLGCEYGQGYLFAKPLTAEQARAFIVRTRIRIRT